MSDRTGNNERSARVVFCERIEPSLEAVSDIEAGRLVTRFQAGDGDAFAGLYKAYFDRVYGYLKVLLRSAHEAEEATQQVFVQVLEALPRYERRGQPFRAWLFIAVRNYGIQHLRKHSRVQVTDPIEIGRHQEQNGSAEEPLDALGWISDGDLLLFVERLPVQQRQVLAMRFMLGLSTKQIGEVLDRAPNDIAVLQYRALGFLRTRLSAIGRGPEAQRGGIQMRRWPRPARVLRRRRFALH